MIRLRSASLRRVAPCLLLLAVGCAPRTPSVAPTERIYYVAADEVAWDYAPTGTNLMLGAPAEGLTAMLMTPANDRIGRVYKKAVYREYSDSTFSTLKQRPPEWEHLGYLGPVLRGHVGDTIRVIFRNNATRPYTMHPHGVFYDKSSEGAVYDDGTTDADRADDGVPPGGTHTYVWPVPERAGPTADEGSSIMWMYHSHLDEPKDVNAGLMGVIIITRAGMMGDDGRPVDVDREFVVAFAEIDENVSWYFEDNINAYAGDPASVARIQTFADLSYTINLRETMNGLSFGHLPGLRMNRGDRVRWYVFGTSNFEVHAPHWHGQTAVAGKMRTDVLSLVTMQMVTADMVPDNPGTWLFHCHVGPHLDFGMSSVFVVD